MGFAGDEVGEVAWRNDLTAALEALLTELRAVAEDHIAIQAIMEEVHSGGTAPPCARAVLSHVAQHPGLARWAGRIQYSPSMGREVSAVDFSAWLITRAAQASSRQAVADLERFLSSTTVTLREVFVIDGVIVSSDVTIDASTHIVPFANIPAIRGGSLLSRLEWDGIATPSAAVIVDFEWPLEPVERHGQRPPWPKPQRPQALLYAIGLATGTAPAVIREWTHLPAEIPMVTSGTITYGVPGASPVHELTPIAAVEAHEIAERLRRLDPTWREHLQVPLQRYWAAQRTADPVSRAIDLGIALESLLLSDLEGQQGELSFRLSLRGSRFLEESMERRKQILTLLRELYTLRSQAVHTGRLRAKDPAGALEQGLALVHRLLTKMIASGKPNWDEVLLG